jgi:hypothetical protein
MPPLSLVLYWGCWGAPGHFLYAPGKQTVHDFECERLRVPRDYMLDASWLFLPQPELVGRGARTYLPACDRTILAWWGSPWDLRGKVNAAVIVDGVHSADVCWERFRRYFPELAAQLTRPDVVKG